MSAKTVLIYLIVMLIFGLIAASHYEPPVRHKFKADISPGGLFQTPSNSGNRDQRATVELSVDMPNEFTWSLENDLIYGEGIIFCNITGPYSECRVDLYFQANSNKDHVFASVSDSTFVFSGYGNHQDIFNLTIGYQDYASNRTKIIWTLHGSYSFGPGQVESIEQQSDTIQITTYFWKMNEIGPLENETNIYSWHENYSYGILIFAGVASILAILGITIIIHLVKKRKRRKRKSE